MKLLGILVAVFALAALFVGFKTEDPSIYLLAGFSAVCAYTTLRSPAISTYLRIFSTIFAVEVIVFGGFTLIEKIGFWPEALAEYTMPVSVPLTVALFSIIVFAVFHLPLVRRIMTIADRYFESRDATTARVWPLPAFSTTDRRVAIAMVSFLVVINQIQVLLSLRLSFFSRDFVNALNAKDATAFWYQLLIVLPVLAFPLIFSYVVEFVMTSTLVIRWRAWLTAFYTGQWLDHHNHYRMGLVGQITDNPDQRISEDVVRFISGNAPGASSEGLGIYTISITLISKFSSLVSFAILLWVLSGGFSLPGTNFVIPGFLFWCALIYAGVGTFCTHVIGRALRRLSFTRQRFEADFRFSLARIREYSEQIALLRGEDTEKVALNKRFSAIVGNYFDIVSVRKRLMAFTQAYGQLSPFIPYIVGAAFYFTGKITFGVLSQIARAFSNVDEALTFFVNYYVNLAEFQSVVDRLVSYETALSRAYQTEGSVAVKEMTGGPDLALNDVQVRLPSGKPLLSHVDVRLNAKENVLFAGPSGTGKSTLFRAIAGIWPFTSGTINKPVQGDIMVLPQKPYIPIGTLRAAVSYPSTASTYADADVKAALTFTELTHLVDQIDVEDNWLQRLSGGEQQRLALARAVLAKPKWLLLDEATGAMDSDLEARLMGTVATVLPDTTLVSIAHGETLQASRSRKIDVREFSQAGREVAAVG